MMQEEVEVEAIVGEGEKGGEDERTYGIVDGDVRGDDNDGNLVGTIGRHSCITRHLLLFWRHDRPRRVDEQLVGIVVAQRTLFFWPLPTTYVTLLRQHIPAFSL